MKVVLLLLLTIFPAGANAQRLSKPSIWLENISKPGHCDEQKLHFYTPWAESYEIHFQPFTSFQNRPKVSEYPARCRAGVGLAWFSTHLEAKDTTYIYRRLDESEAHNFYIYAIRGTQCLASDTITLQPCKFPPSR